MDADKTYQEKARLEMGKNATRYIKQILKATLLETASVWSLNSYL